MTIGDMEAMIISENTAGGFENEINNDIKATQGYWVVASCGNAFSGDLSLTVYPFILRGVHLKDIYSANCPMGNRIAIRNKVATDYRLDTLDSFCSTNSLGELGDAIDGMLAGKSSGRKVISLKEEV